MIWFQSEDQPDAAFAGLEIAEISRTKAVFIKIPCNTDREPSPWAEESRVPTNKLLSENPSRDYGIPVGRSTVVIADSWGNEYFRSSSTPSHRTLESYIAKVTEGVKRTNEKLQKTLDRAREAHDKQDRKAALRHIFTNFKYDIYGLPAQEATVALYRELMDDAREEINKLVEKKDADSLKALARELKRTDVEKEIDAALEKLS